MFDALVEPRNSPVCAASDLSVVSIAHTAVSRSMGRLRYEPLTSQPNLDLTLVAPARWHEYGRDIVADPPRPGIRLLTENIRLPKAGPAKWYLHHYPRLARILREAAPDVIHLWEEPWSLVALQAARWRERYRPSAALVLETDQNIQRALPPPFEQIRRYVLSQTDMLIYRTPEALRVSQSCGYVGPGRMVEYGIDTSIFKPSNHVPTQVPFTGRDFTLGYVGRLVPEKGLLDVVEGISLSKANITLQLLGEGPQRDAIQASAAALGVKVEFNAPRTPEGVASFICGLDALVLMSRTTATWKEQFGRVIMEAHGCRVPVIGSSSGSIPAVVGRGGWIVEEGNTSALANLLQTLTTTPEILTEMGKLGYEDAMRRFTYTAVAEGLLQAWHTAAICRKSR